jgi:hypothetical protein
MYCTRRRRRRIVSSSSSSPPSAVSTLYTAAAETKQVLQPCTLNIVYPHTCVCWSIRPRADGDQFRRIGTSLSSYVVVGVLFRGEGIVGKYTDRFLEGYVWREGMI